MSEPFNAVWYAVPPRTRAKEPAWMSVSTLLAIETCPRRWSLSFSEYPEIWERSGYPPKPYFATLAGQITHSSLESITKALDRAGCSSIRTALFISVLRELGGFTKIIETKIDQLLKILSLNPRAQHNLAHLRTKLHSKVPELRTRLQMLISKLQIQSRDVSTYRSQETSIGRSPLTVGMHAEVELRAERLGWRGFVDFMNLSETECEIIDFKTGDAKPEHEFQTRVYSLLWARDAELNPHARLVDRLVLSYFESEIEVTPLKTSEMDDFEKDLMTRTENALSLVRQEPPPAYPSVLNCRFCPVRQICDEYWTATTQKQLKAERLAEAGVYPNITLIDIEVELVERQSLTNWSAIVTTSADVPPGTTVYVQFSQANMPLLNMLEVGKQSRLIEASLIPQVEDQASSEFLIVMNTMSEAFIV